MAGEIIMSEFPILHSGNPIEQRPFLSLTGVLNVSGETPPGKITGTVYFAQDVVEHFGYETYHRLYGERHKDSEPMSLSNPYHHTRLLEDPDGHPMYSAARFLMFEFRDQLPDDLIFAQTCPSSELTDFFDDENNQSFVLAILSRQGTLSHGGVISREEANRLKEKGGLPDNFVEIIGVDVDSLRSKDRVEIDLSNPSSVTISVDRQKDQSLPDK